MRLPPLDVLISWPRPNYVDPVTRSTALLVTNGIFVSGMVLAVGLRFYSRIKVKNWYGVDDGFIAVATVFAVALCVVVIIGNEMFCWDRHTWDVPWNKIKGAMIIAFVAKIAFTLAATTTRISLLCLYYRLVQDSGIRWFRWALHLTLAYLVAICVMFVFLVIFGCVPVEAYWNFPPNNSARCLNEGTITVTAGVLNCVSDFLVATLPIPIVMRLRMPLRQRVGVCILLSLGYVVTVAGIVRTYFIYKSLVATYDETWYSYPLWIAATVEIDLAVICACAPAIHTLVKRKLSELSSRLSRKLSSLKSPSVSPNSSKPSTQESKKSSKKRSRAHWLYTGSIFDTTVAGEEEDIALAEQPQGSLQQMSSADGSCGGVSSEGLDDGDAIYRSGPSHLPLRIVKTSTLEQASTYDEGRDQLPSEIRDQWLQYHRDT